MVYVHIGSVLILPESMSRLRENQHKTNVIIHHVLCDPYLVSFPFFTIPICLFLKIHRIFYLLVIYTVLQAKTVESEGFCSWWIFLTILDDSEAHDISK